MPKKSQLTVFDAIVHALAIFDKQGYIRPQLSPSTAKSIGVKSNFYWSPDLTGLGPGKVIISNTALLNNTLFPSDAMSPKSSWESAIVDDKYEVKEHHKQCAREIIDEIEERIIANKISGNLNRIDTALSDLVKKANANTAIDIKDNISLIASIPQSVTIQKKRDTMEELYQRLTHTSRWIADPDRPILIDVVIKDVKYISIQDCVIITALDCTTESNLIVCTTHKAGKNNVNIQAVLEGRKYKLTGLVSDTKLGKFSKCNETHVEGVILEPLE